MLKIGLTGAGGTGKGTLGRRLAAKMEMFGAGPTVFIESPIQEVGKMIFPNAKNYKDMDVTSHIISQYSYLFHQIATEKALLKEEYNIIAERSVFDILSYTINLLGDDPSNLLAVNNIRRIVKDYINSSPYDIIFKFPIEFTAQDNQAWKERDDESRNKTDEVIDSLLSSFQSPESTVTLTGTVDSRLTLAMNTVIAYYTKE